MRREERGETRCKNETTRAVLSKLLELLLHATAAYVEFDSNRWKILCDNAMRNMSRQNSASWLQSEPHLCVEHTFHFPSFSLFQHNLSVIIEFYESYFRNASITKLFVFHNLDVLWTYLQHHLQNSNNEQNEVNVEYRCRTRVEEEIPLHRR